VGQLALRLARWYRDAGRSARARELEEDLAKLLGAADNDFPLLIALRQQRARSD
jgi:hypothetical protein